MENLIWLLGILGYKGSGRSEVSCHSLYYVPAEQDAFRYAQGEPKKGRVGTQLPGEQKTAPNLNLEAAKENGTVAALPFEVLLTQGFTHGKLDRVVVRAQ